MVKFPSQLFRQRVTRMTIAVSLQEAISIPGGIDRNRIETFGMMDKKTGILTLTIDPASKNPILLAAVKTRRADTDLSKVFLPTSLEVTCPDTAILSATSTQRQDMTTSRLDKDTNSTKSVGGSPQNVTQIEGTARFQCGDEIKVSTCDTVEENEEDGE